MNLIAKLIFFLAFGLISNSLIGQELVYYKFSVATGYFPSCGRQSEEYVKYDNEVKRSATSIDWKHCKRVKTRKLPKNDDIENTINLLDSLNRLEEFTFEIKRALIDTLKSRHFWKDTYHISDKDIDDFFSNGNTVTLELDDIKQEIIEGTVIDGAPYSFELILIREGQDTLKYSFTGNFLDGVQTSNIENWIPMYMAYQENKFFDSIYLVEDYFSDKNLERILFRFIMWTKNND